MDKEILEKIQKKREELVKLDEKMLKLKNKGSFAIFFAKSLLIAVVFVFISKFLKLSDGSKILVFVFIFIIANFLQGIFINKNNSKEIEEIKKQQIKIQADIFKLSKKLKK